MNFNILLLFVHRVEKLRSKIILRNFYAIYIYIYAYSSKPLPVYNLVISAAGCSDVLCVPRSFLFIILARHHDDST